MSIENAEVSRRLIYSHELDSEFLQERRTIKVFVPSQVNLTDLQRKYPVLYCHDGNEFFTHGRIVTLTRQLLDAGEVQPFIIVALAVHMATRTADYHPAGHRHELYRRFVTEEAVPWVESHFPVSRDSSGKFMAGVSLGAAATLSIHLQQPEHFHQLLLFSGAYFEEQQRQVQRLGSSLPLQAFMVVGRQETAVQSGEEPQDFYHLNVSMRDLLRLHGATVEYHEADGSHVWGLWQSFIPQAVRWVNRRLGQ